VNRQLAGQRIAFLTANEGVEQVELTQVWAAVEQAGGRPVLIAPVRGKVQAFHHLTRGHTFPAELAVAEARAEDFAGLVLPGGVANPDQLRMVAAAVAFAGEFARAAKPVAAICHAAWTLIEADLVRDKRLTSWPSLRTDIRNAGGEWVDEAVVVCLRRYPLISSRKPADLPAFCRETVRALSATARA
jgi:protease I